MYNYPFSTSDIVQYDHYTETIGTIRGTAVMDKFELSSSTYIFSQNRAPALNILFSTRIVTILAATCQINPVPGY